MVYRRDTDSSHISPRRDCDICLLAHNYHRRVFHASIALLAVLHFSELSFRVGLGHRGNFFSCQLNKQSRHE